MESYRIFRDLAIIIFAAKICGLAAKKLKAPQVVGEIIAGLLLGPSVLGIVDQSDFLSQMAEIGVILLMFSAGLGTNLKDMLKTGPAALLIAAVGVFVPLVAGYLLYSCFYGFAAIGSEEFYKAIFIGVIMTATSVSITVQTLRELGHLKSRVGTLILNAAIIDDVIGIIVLTFVVGFKDPESDPLSVVGSTLLFFLFCGIVGFLIFKLFKWFDKKYPHKRRIPILGLSLCFALAYIAERFFGIADITGAYIAGLILCSLHDSDYIAEKMDINSYMLFGPVFFASIGLKTEFSGFTVRLLLFSAAFTIVAMIAKVIGCGITARAFGYSSKDSLRVGVGMMTRGEVALIVSQKGLAVGLLEPEYFTSVILLIICSSVVTPVIMKLLYRNEDPPEDKSVAEKADVRPESGG